METLTLPIYPTLEHKVNPVPKVNISQQFNYTNPQALLENAIESLLPQYQEESLVVKTRRNLGKTAETLSDEQIECIVAEFQFLANSWLDEFEQEVFRGKTLKEVLNEG